MQNWSTDTTVLKKSPEKYAIWRLEQQINYGLMGEKLSTSLLKKFWTQLHIDPKRKKVLNDWIW